MKISELVDIDGFRELCESFTALTGLVTAILDLEGNIIIATGWQDICTRFHRDHPLTAQRCRESDTILAGLIEEKDTYTIYKCKNGLIDVSARITIGGEHIGNLFTGQFFLEAPDVDFFIHQANECGFDKVAYLDALSKVPIIDENYLRTMMRFFYKLSHLIGEMGQSKKRLEEVNIELHMHRSLLEKQVKERTSELTASNKMLQTEITERKLVEKALLEKEEQYRNFFSTSRDCVFITSFDGHWIDLNDAAVQLFGYGSREDLLKVKIQDLYANPDDRKRLRQIIAEYGYAHEMPITLRQKDGTFIDTIITTVIKKDGTGRIIGYQGTIRDITEHKRIVMLLRASEERFRSLVETTSDWIWETDAQGAYTYASPKVKDILGYESSEILGKTPMDLMPPFEAERVKEALFQYFEEQKPFVIFENLNHHKDGSLVALETNGIPVVDENGQLTGYRGIDRDITERKRAEDALRESEAMLRGVFKATPVGLCIMKDRVFQSVNKSYSDNLGYSESDIIGHTPRLLYENEEEYERVGRELFSDLLERGLTSVRTRHRRKDGSIRDVALTAVPLQVRNTSAGMVVVTVEDITERKRAEEKLRKSKRQLADIIEFLPDATLVIDKEGKVIAWNRSMETMSGVKKEDMLGKGNYEYSLPFYGVRRPVLIDFALHPNRQIEKHYTSIRRTCDVLFVETFTPNLPAGNLHLSGTASVLRDGSGEVIAAIECIRDNTERKKLEEQLNRAQKMEALGTLAGGVAHDLNNVLGVLAGYSELLVEMLPEDSAPRRYADNIFKSGIRAAAIIQDLLALARRGVTVSEVVDLNKIVSDYLKTPEFEKLKFYHPHVIISTELEDGLLNIKGSPVHLGKTIMNLVSNAAEAISELGKVTVRTENRYLDLPIKGYDEMKEGDYVVLMVSDTGTGISPNDVEKIFEPFYTKKAMGRSGTGLGLAVVWGTVKDHNGYIDVQSEEGKGTNFTLYFPVTREEVANVKKTMSSDYYMSKGESILVVDDVKEQRELAMNILERLGYRVAAVAGGEEAIKYIKSKKADLIILDMIMDPGIDGYETYHRIREINPRQKAIIVSGFSETDRVRKVQEMGAGEFVRKPYTMEKIGLGIRKELDRK